jgi:hypothetical protein
VHTCAAGGGSKGCVASAACKGPHAAPRSGHTTHAGRQHTQLTFGQLSPPVKEPFHPLASSVAPPNECPPPRKITCSRTVSCRMVSKLFCTPVDRGTHATVSSTGMSRHGVCCS